MIGLPTSTEINKALPKTAIFTKFDLKTSQKKCFDEEISRLNIVNVISPTTIPSLPHGEKVESIYVIEVVLKKKDYSAKNIILLNKCIPQKMLFILRYNEMMQLAICHYKFFCTEWTNKQEIELSGLNLDKVWENLVIFIGKIRIINNNTLLEQIDEDTTQEKVRKEIRILEQKVSTEKQPRRKLELFEKLKNLRKIYHD